MNENIMEVTSVCSSYGEVFKSDDFFRWLDIILDEATDLFKNRTEEELDKYKDSIKKIFLKYKDWKKVNKNDKELLLNFLENPSVTQRIWILLNRVIQISTKYWNIWNEKRNNWNNIIKEMFIWEEWKEKLKLSWLILNIKEQLNIIDLDIEWYIYECFEKNKIIWNNKLVKILWIWNIKSYDNNWLIIWEKWLAKVNIASWNILYNTWNLWIWDFYRDYNNNDDLVLYWNLWIATFDEKTWIVLSNTWNLWIWVIEVYDISLWVIKWKKWIWVVDLTVSEVKWVKKDLWIWKIITIWKIDNNSISTIKWENGELLINISNWKSQKD